MSVLYTPSSSSSSSFYSLYHCTYFCLCAATATLVINEGSSHIMHTKMRPIVCVVHKLNTRGRWKTKSVYMGMCVHVLL